MHAGTALHSTALPSTALLGIALPGKPLPGTWLESTACPAPGWLALPGWRYLSAN